VEEDIALDPIDIGASIADCVMLTASNITVEVEQLPGWLFSHDLSFFVSIQQK